MKIGIDIGHNCPPDIGASSIRLEDELSANLGSKLINKLIGLGYEVVNCTPYYAKTIFDSLNKRVATANNNKVDLFISIHFNAGGERGTEAFTISPIATLIAKKIVENISSLGFKNRGVKEGNRLYVLKNTISPAILLEVCFLDSEEDMRLYNDESISSEIVKAITYGKVTENYFEKEYIYNSILEIQQKLNRLQIKDSSGKFLIENGIIDNSTIESIKNFQSIVGIYVDGILGQVSLNSLKIIVAKPLIMKGNYNKIGIRYIQWRLGAGVDGIFGDTTEKAVKQFQKKNNLIDDGIVGKNTWNKLISD